MSRYGVKNLNDDSIHSEETDFDKARSTAIALSNWNIPCQIIDMETGEPLKDTSTGNVLQYRPYNELFAERHCK